MDKEEIKALKEVHYKNIKDMLDNGTVINKRMIESPKSFQVACTVMTQIIAQVASSQYGGQSISLAHLSPFIKETRKTIKRHHPDFPESMIEDLVLDDVKSGIQTLQYQIITLMTTNGWVWLF